LSDGPVGEHLPDRLANEANLFIEANKNRPFFAYFSFYSVHVPLVPREDLLLKYEQKRAALGLSDQFGIEGNNQVRQVQSNTSYAAMVEAMDMAVGKVIHQLKVLGLYDNTIIVFFSDNGGLSTAEGLPTANLPLRAGKGWLYEGGTREPLIVKWSGIAHPGSVTDVPVISTDFYPSLLEMAQLSPAPEQALDAKSFVPILKGQSFKQRPLFWHYPHYGNQGGTPGSAIRNGDWKLIRWYEDKPRTELFNLKVDLGEQHNVIAQYPTLAKKLNQQLDKWLVEQNAVLPQKNPYFKK
jgi:arylsulfatase A-like enzyme